MTPTLRSAWGEKWRKGVQEEQEEELVRRAHTEHAEPNPPHSTLDASQARSLARFYAPPTTYSRPPPMRTGLDWTGLDRPTDRPRHELQGMRDEERQRMLAFEPRGAPEGLHSSTYDTSV